VIAASDLYLRRVDHPQAHDNYRVILNLDDEVLEIGSIGIQYTTGMNAVWRWGIDTVLPMRSPDRTGEGQDRADCMRQFRAAWMAFAAVEANLAAFLDAKRRARR